MMLFNCKYLVFYFYLSLTAGSFNYLKLVNHIIDLTNKERDDLGENSISKIGDGNHENTREIRHSKPKHVSDCKAIFTTYKNEEDDVTYMKNSDSKRKNMVTNAKTEFGIYFKNIEISLGNKRNICVEMEKFTARFKDRTYFSEILDKYLDVNTSKNIFDKVVDIYRSLDCYKAIYDVENWKPVEEPMDLGMLVNMIGPKLNLQQELFVLEGDSDKNGGLGIDVINELDCRLFKSALIWSLCEKLENEVNKYKSLHYDFGVNTVACTKAVAYLTDDETRDLFIAWTKNTLSMMYPLQISSTINSIDMVRESTPSFGDLSKDGTKECHGDSTNRQQTLLQLMAFNCLLGISYSEGVYKLIDYQTLLTNLNECLINQTGLLDFMGRTSEKISELNDCLQNYSRNFVEVILQKYFVIDESSKDGNIKVDMLALLRELRLNTHHSVVSYLRDCFSILIDEQQYNAIRLNNPEALINVQNSDLQIWQGMYDSTYTLCDILSVMKAMSCDTIMDKRELDINTLKEAVPNKIYHSVTVEFDNNKAQSCSRMLELVNVKVGKVMSNGEVIAKLHSYC